MGQMNSFKSIEKLAEDSIEYLNEKINSIDWNKKWGEESPKELRAAQEMELLHKPEIKEAIKEAFNEQSLVVTRLNEVPQ